MRMGISAIICLAFILYAQKDEGGPDGYGYHYLSTQEPGDTVTFFWIAPCGHDSITNWTPNPDDGWVYINLPYRFPFYGDTLDSIIVCSNGFLQFPTTFTTYRNAPLPVTRFHHLISIFWTDLDVNQSGGVYYYHDPTFQATVITWSNVIQFNNPDTLSAQVILYHDGKIRINYLRTPNNASQTTIGIQGNGGEGNHFLQYVYNGNPPQHIPDDSTSIIFFRPVFEHDVGIIALISPGKWLPANSQCPIKGIIKNYGTSYETFSTKALITRRQSPSDTVFKNSLTITNIAPDETTVCYWGDFITPPHPDSWQLTIITELAPDQYPHNDSLKVTISSHPLPLGTIISSWDFPGIGPGMNLGGITYSPTFNRFYIATNSPNRVFSFPLSNPADLRYEPFALQSFFGDDIIWGIGWDRTTQGFWLTHVSGNNDDCILARYTADGIFTGDTWNLSDLIPAWLAGIDQEDNGTFWAVGVGVTNRIYRLDPTAKSILDSLSAPPPSWRACSFLGDRNAFLFSGGWNENLLVQLDAQGNIIKTAPLSHLADLSIYRPSSPHPDSLILAYATTNNYNNTLLLISLGLTWSSAGVKETPSSITGLPSQFNVVPNPVKNNLVYITTPRKMDTTRLNLSLYDINGRIIQRKTVPAGEKISWRLTNLPAGVFWLHISGKEVTETKKIIIVPGN